MVDGLDLPKMADRALVTDDEDFLFSPDGEHVATAGRIQDWWRPVVDATIGPGGNGVGNATFDGDLVSFTVAGEDGLHRVTTRLRTG